MDPEDPEDSEQGAEMARIRSIKPEFWSDGKIVRLGFAARLAFIGLWNFADDDGYLLDEPDRLQIQILPRDDVDMAGLIEELVAGGMVERLILPDGRALLAIRNFSRHQKVSHPTPTKFPVAAARAALRQIPERAGNLASAPESSGVLVSHPEISRALRPEGKGREREEEAGVVDASAPEPTPSAATPPAEVRSPADRSVEVHGRCLAIMEEVFGGSDPALIVVAEIDGWLRLGAEPEIEIYPEIRAIAEKARARGDRIQVWSYFSPAIRRALKRRALDPGAAPGSAARSGGTHRQGAHHGGGTGLGGGGASAGGLGGAALRSGDDAAILEGLRRAGYVAPDGSAAGVVHPPGRC